MTVLDLGHDFFHCSSLDLCQHRVLFNNMQSKQNCLQPVLQKHSNTFTKSPPCLASRQDVADIVVLKMYILCLQQQLVLEAELDAHRSVGSIFIGQNYLKKKKSPPDSETFPSKANKWHSHNRQLARKFLAITTNPTEGSRGAVFKSIRPFLII